MHEFLSRIKDSIVGSERGFVETYRKKKGNITAENFTDFAETSINICQNHFKTVTYELINNGNLVAFGGLNHDEQLQIQDEIRKSFSDSNQVVFSLHSVGAKLGPEVNIRWSKDDPSSVHIESWSGRINLGEIGLSRKFGQSVNDRKGLGRFLRDFSLD